MWPALLKAKEHARAISHELDRMLRDGNSLSKRDIARHNETILAEIDRSAAIIQEEIDELKASLKAHRKYFQSKHAFMKRHYKRL